MHTPSGPFAHNAALKIKYSNMSTSLQVFRAYLRVMPDGTIDASQIHSKDCYYKWLESRGTRNQESEARKFQRSLSNHLGGVDGRSPFDLEEEVAILRVLRKKGNWPCFSSDTRIGSMGYRSRGFHEKQKDTPKSASVDSPLIAPPPPLAISAPSCTFSAELQPFADSILTYSQSFAQIGVDVSSSAYGLLMRFCSGRLPYLHNFPLSRSNQSIPYDFYRQLAAKYGEDGDYVINVYSLGEFENRFLAQNQTSKRLLGDFTNMTSVPRLIRADEWGKLSYHLGLAYSTPGQETAWFDLAYTSGLVFRATVVVDPISCCHAGIAKLIVA
ncbi:hypothetical protein BASA81_007131 [Batrachochytrium salamandrivorans]|nr:hypothetical protein BASA81_007131 [Batrachochytrium salamandrivorans]